MEVLKMLHGAQGAVWLCLVRIPISATRLENTNPADNREQQKKTINKTIREKEKKKKQKFRRMMATFIHQSQKDSRASPLHQRLGQIPLFVSANVQTSKQNRTTHP